MKTKPMYQSKTFWACIAGVLSAAGGFFTGEMDLAQTLQLGLTSLIGLFLRDAVRG
jgi:hypothetical protein